MRVWTMSVLLGILAACGRVGGDETAEGTGTAGMQHDMGAVVDTTGLRERAVPAEFASGAELYAASCAACHGEAALGTTVGPPLVHIIYEPNHHADISFIFAAERGVQAHHWGFGDMPPVPGVTREQVTEIVGYVRWLQREAGIR